MTILPAFGRPAAVLDRLPDLACDVFEDIAIYMNR